MSEYVIETIQYKGCTIKIIQDSDADSPRNWDNAGTMLCKHRNYDLGDTKGRERQPSAEEIIEITKRDDVIFLPLYLLDHSGLWMRAGSPSGNWTSNKGRFECDEAGWDVSTVGIIYMTKEKAVKEWGKKRYTKSVEQKAINCLQGEVETYNDYLTGNVAGFVAETSDGEHINSCWGFYPDHPTVRGKGEWDYPISEAKSAIDYWLKNNSGARFMDIDEGKEVQPA